MRTRLLGTVVLLLSIVALPGRGTLETRSAPRGELRIVDRGGLTWAWVTWNVFEHPIRIDQDGQLMPELATSWHWLDDRTLEVKLRRGVKFQNGEVFDADAVRINVEETKQLRHRFTSAPTSTSSQARGLRLSIPTPFASSFRSPTVPPWRGSVSCTSRAASSTRRSAGATSTGE